MSRFFVLALALTGAASKSVDSPVVVLDKSSELCENAENAAFHWKEITKTDGRVDEESFLAYFKSTAFGEAAEDSHPGLYDAFLKSLFSSGLMMMPATTKLTLGQHCFSAVAPLAFTFYKNGGGGYCW